VRVNSCADKACEKSFAGELNDQVLFKSLSSAFAGLGAEDCNSVLTDMKSLVAKVVGHSFVVQKKDGLSLDQYPAKVVYVFVKEQLTVDFVGGVTFLCVANIPILEILWLSVVFK